MMPASAILADLDDLDAGSDDSYGEQLAANFPMPGSLGLMDLDLSDMSDEDDELSHLAAIEGEINRNHAPPMDVITEESD
jgi:hypothetical protein